jgi:hypothetical protein
MCWRSQATLFATVALLACRQPAKQVEEAPGAQAPADAAANDAHVVKETPPDATPAARPEAPAELPAWPGDEPQADAVVVHAADASGEHLRALVSEADSYLVAATDLRVTGRVRAASKAAAARALAAAYPDGGLEPARPRKMRGRAVKVDLAFTAVDTANLIRLLADVLGLNIVTPSDDLPAISVAVRRAPADGVLDALVDVLGFTSVKWGNTIFATPNSGEEPDARFRKMSRPRLDIDVKGARASDVVALLDAVHSSPFAAQCAAGPKLRFRMRNAYLGAILATLQLRSGTALKQRTGDGESCGRAEPSSITRENLSSFRLVGIILYGKKAAAAFRAEQGDPVIVARGDVLPAGTVTAIGAGYVRIEQATRDTLEIATRDEPDHVVADQPPPDAPWRDIANLEKSRLAATVIAEGHKRALIEDANGVWHLLEDSGAAAFGPYRVWVSPRRVLLEMDGKPHADLSMRGR